jgi:AraC-like DNA-binding protein
MRRACSYDPCMLRGPTLPVHVERYETEVATWEVARRPTQPALQPYLLAAPEGWTQTRGGAMHLREVPFPGVPLIFNLGEPWQIAVGADRDAVAGTFDSFLAGLHTRPAFVRGSADSACIELRLTPLGMHRLLGVPMAELANRTLALGELLPGAHDLTGRLRDAASWSQRFDLVEEFLARRLADSTSPLPALEWSWEQLRRTGGRAPIGNLAGELGWSHRRLIARFHEQIGLAPKTLARVIRFDRAVSSLRARGTPSLAEIACDCGYFDQAHMNRDFRELAGMTPVAFVAAELDSGAVPA